MVVRIGNTVGEFRVRYVGRVDVRRARGQNKWTNDKKLRWLMIDGWETDIDGLDDLTGLVDEVGEIVVGKYDGKYYIEILDGYRE